MPFHAFFANSFLKLDSTCGMFFGLPIADSANIAALPFAVAAKRELLLVVAGHRPGSERLRSELLERRRFDGSNSSDLPVQRAVELRMELLELIDRDLSDLVDLLIDGARITRIALLVRR